MHAFFKIQNTKLFSQLFLLIIFIVHKDSFRHILSEDNSISAFVLAVSSAGIDSSSSYLLKKRTAEINER